MSDITLELSFAERSIINIALDYYKPVTASDATALAALKQKVARTKCGDSGCTYCGDDPQYGYNDD
jgi:hypothetical protein